MRRLSEKDKKNLELMLKNHVPKSKIAQVIGVSRKCIYYHINHNTRKEEPEYGR